jgi:plastocyanin
MKLRVLVPALVLVALVAAGYAARTQDVTKGASAAANSSETDSTLVLMAKSYRFEPTLLEIPAGTKLTWVNDDNFTHNVQLTGGLDWTSPTLKPGESVSRSFDVPGTYDYLCVFHSQNMRARVIVLPGHVGTDG